MFDITNKELIQSIIDKTKEIKSWVIPVYVKIGVNYYDILNLNEITFCSPSIFKIGFGTKSILPENSPVLGIEVAQTFNVVDEDTGAFSRYTVFEYGIESMDTNNEDEILKTLDNWVQLLFSNISNIVEEKRKSTIFESLNDESNRI